MKTRPVREPDESTDEEEGERQEQPLAAEGHAVDRGHAWLVHTLDLAEGQVGVVGQGDGVLERVYVLEQLANVGAQNVGRKALDMLDLSRPDLDFVRLGRDAWAKAPAISFDRAVLERTDRAWIVALKAGWSDVGSWSALWGGVL